MDAQIFVDELFGAAAKAKVDEFQIRYSKSARNSISVYEKEVLDCSFAESQNVRLEVKIGAKIGGFSCEELEKKNISKIVEQAIENAKIIDCEDEAFFHDGSGEYQEAKRYAPMKEEFEKLDKIAFLKKLEQDAYENPLINKVISTRLSYGENASIIRNSLGLNLSSCSSFASASLYLSAKKGDVIKTGGAVSVFAKPEDFLIENLINEAVYEATSKLDAVDVESQKTSVIFKNETFANFLSMIAALCSAENVQEKRSKLKDKIGDFVASKVLTIVDNPLLEGGFATTSFDGEGFPTKEKYVIKDGVLQTFLQSMKTANKDGVKSTGNGSGGGVMPYNFYILPGEKTEAELLREMGEGVYVDAMHGLHAGFNIVSGDLSFGAEGFLVENGLKSKALNQFSISANLYQMLKDVRVVGSDLIFKLSQFGSPAAWVDNVSISNK